MPSFPTEHFMLRPHTLMNKFHTILTFLSLYVKGYISSSPNTILRLIEVGLIIRGRDVFDGTN